MSDEPKAPATYEEQLQQAKELDGSINLFLGPPGCGKTDRSLRVSLAMGYYAPGEPHSIPWFGYDSNGTLRETFKGIFEYEKQRYRKARASGDKLATEQADRKLSYLASSKCITWFDGPRHLERLLDTILGWVDLGMREMKDAPVNKPLGARAVVMIDEAGAVRQHAESFWPFMRQARNARLTLFTNGHRDKDLHPAALACVRVACLWRSVHVAAYDINGCKIPRSKCAPPKTNVVRYIIGGNPTVHEWVVDENSPTYPPCLIVPAQPSKARAAGF